MDITNILYPILTIGGMGLIFGLGLGYAGKVFHVEEDPRLTEVLNSLPGVNCGGCGFTGCGGYAQAIIEGKTETNKCPVGGEVTAQSIANIMGISALSIDKKTAYVKCGGDCEKASSKYIYNGFSDCSAIHQLANNGPKDCNFGCLGGGSCERACDFGAISIIDGLAVIDQNKCTACGKCVSLCPSRLIELIPINKTVRVRCNSWDKGKDVKDFCLVGCIGCNICEKTCKFQAITITTNLSKIDYNKCTLCTACVKKCPSKAIDILNNSI